MVTITSMYPKNSGKLTVGEATLLYKELLATPLIVDNNWYLIATTWWNRFLEGKDRKNASGGMVDLPPISNGALTINQNGAYFLRSKLVEGVNFVLVPEEIFNILRIAYGLESEERDVIRRKVVSGTALRSEPFVEIYLLKLKVAHLSDRANFVNIQISHADSAEQIRRKIMQALGIREEDFKNHSLFIENADENCEKLPQSISIEKFGSYLYNGATIFVGSSDKPNQFHKNEMKRRSPQKSVGFVDCIGGAEKVLDKVPSNAEGSGRKIGSVSDEVNVSHLEGKAEDTPNEQIDANKIVPPSEDVCATNVGREVSDEVNDEAIDEIEWADEPSLKELSGELPSTRKRMEERITFELMKKENGELRKANAKLNGEVRALYKEIGEKNGVEQELRKQVEEWQARANIEFQKSEEWLINVINKKVNSLAHEIRSQQHANNAEMNGSFSAMSENNSLSQKIEAASRLQSMYWETYEKYRHAGDVSRKCEILDQMNRCNGLFYQLLHSAQRQIRQSD